MALRRWPGEVASEPGEHSFTKGKENFTEAATVNSVKSCNDFETYQDLSLTASQYNGYNYHL